MKKINRLSIILCILLLMCNVSHATTYYKNDVTPPWGKISIVGGTPSNDVIYVEDESVTVKIEATDDMCKKEEIKYYLNTTPITETTVIPNESWKSLANGDTATVQLSSGGGLQHIYVVFKDINGNTSYISKSNNQTLKFDVNGGTNAPTGIDTTRLHGAPFSLTNQMPKREGYYFLGWSTDPMATAPSFRAGDKIPADMVIAGDTLYAVYTPNIEELPVLSDTTRVGEKIDLPIKYTNVDSDGNGTEAYYTDWRVLSIEDDGSINLVSAGTPLNFYHDTAATNSVTALTTNFLTTTFDSNNFSSSDKRKVFENEFIREDATGNPMVRALTAEDIYKVTGLNSMSLGNGMELSHEKYANLFVNDAYYWVATNDGSNNLYYINPNGEVGSSNSKQYGIRVVVTLKGNIKLSDKDKTGEWNIDVPQYMDLIPSKANAPVLGEGMKAVYWTNENGTGETTATAYTSSMYNYTIGDGIRDTKENKWANAITEEDGSYWVWIPRYAYKITYTDADKTSKNGETTTIATIDGEKTQYGNIDILFMYGKSNTHYRDLNGNAVALPEGYKVHPAFQKMETEADLATNPLGKWDVELEGIWVAKYEASMEKTADGGVTWTNTNTSSTTVGDILTSSTVRVVSKPSVTSWRFIRQSYVYQNSLEMHPNLNSHEIKNSEWGAVAYLTESAYGRNGNEIAVNQCENFYTGAGPGIGDSTVYNGEYVYDLSNFSTSYAWNTEQGKLASTTGNIYGVYDMAGGAYEYVASYLNNGNSYISDNSYGGVLGTSTDIKTKQLYEGRSIDVYGDAVYETSIDGSMRGSWYNDYSIFPGSRNYVFFARSGISREMSYVGTFCFINSPGGYEEIDSFRPVLCVSDEYVVKLNANGGTVSTDSITVVKGGTYGGLPTPEKAGYEFLGWYTEDDVKVTSTTTIVKNANHTLIAKWESKTKQTANKPILGDGMKAVYWSDENASEELTATAHEQGITYNYVKGDGKTDTKQSKWANAITEEDGSYWVWIPRYAYKITYYGDAAKTIVKGETTSTATISGEKTKIGDIDILFMKGKSYTEYYDENGNVLTGLPEGYKVHPAFQAMSTAEDLATNPLGKWDEELEGIWVAKYEASREDLVNSEWVAYEDQATYGGGNAVTSTTIRMVSKPSRLSWRGIEEKNIYSNSLNMYENLGSHEMKNSEWGAVAYLAQSAYGRNGNEIGINQNYLGLDAEGYEIPAYTGAGPGGTADVQGTTYEYDATFESTYAWNTAQGKKASTTGNIYGVYDLNGGTWEYMAGYVNNGNGNLASYGGTLTDATNMHTKQVYKTIGASATRTENYALNSGVYGDAVYETSTKCNSSSDSWNGDFPYFPYAGYPFFERGAGCNDGSNAGAFAFHSNNGGANHYIGFRPVLCFTSRT